MDKEEFKNDIGTMARGTGMAGFGSVFQTLSGFAIVALQVRYVGLEKYGAFAIAFGISTLLTVPLRMGLDSGVNHFLVKARLSKSADDLWGTFWLTMLIPISMGLVFAATSIKFVPLINSRFYQSEYFLEAMTLFGFGLPLLAIADLPALMTRAFETNRYYVISYNLLGQGSEACLLLGLWMLPFSWIPQDSLTAVVVLRLFSRGLVLMGGVYGFTVLARIRHLIPTGLAGHIQALIGHIRAFKKIFLYSVPLLLSSVFLRIMQWTDTIIIGAYLNTTAAGAYRVAVQLALALTGVLTSIGSILAPMVARYHHEGRHDKIVPLYVQSVRLSTLGVLPFVVSMAIFPAQFLMLFDSEATMATTALILLVFAQLFNTFTGNVGNILAMAGKPHWHAINGLVVTIGQVVMCLLLVPRFGLIGAALASLITIVLLNWLRFLETKWFFGLYCICRQTLEPFVPAIGVGLCLWIVNKFLLQSVQHWHILLISGAFFISTITIWGLHGLLFLRPEDSQFLHAITQRIKSTGIFVRARERLKC